MPTGAGDVTEQSGLDFLIAQAQNGQNESEEALVKSVWQMLMSGKKYRGKHDPLAEEGWDLYLGNDQKRPRYSINRASVNLTHRAVETFLGNITDNVPMPKPRAVLPQNQKIAKIVQYQLDYIYRHNSGIVTIRRPIRSSLISGIGWLRVDWDETDLRGKGDVRFSPRDPRSIWVSPGSDDPWLSDALYVIEARNVPREYVTRLWEKGSQVPPGIWDGSLPGAMSIISGLTMGEEDFSRFTTTTGDQSWGSFGVAAKEDRQGLVTLLEAWIRRVDGTLRYVVIANGVVLEDGASPYEDEKYPYVPFIGIRLEGYYYPVGVVPFIRGLQHEMNELHSYAMDIIHFMADPILVMDEENLEVGAKVDNAPGAIFPKLRGSDIHYLESRGLHPEYVTLQEQIKSYVDDVLGNVDILSGIRPAGVNTLGGLEVLRDQANVRLRMMVEDMRQSLRILYERGLSRFRQFAHDERVVRISGTGMPGGESFVEINKVVGFGLDGTPQKVNTIPEDAEFEIDFDTAPGGPAGRQARKEEALTLLQAGVIDQEAVLKDYEREDAQEILERFNQTQMAIQQAEEEAAKAAPQEGPAAQPASQSGNVVADALRLMSGLKR